MTGTTRYRTPAMIAADEACEGLPPIFRRCLDATFQTADLSRPFIDGDSVCATDGRIVVRCPKDAAGTKLAGMRRVGDGLGKKLPKVAEIFGRFGGRDEVAVPMPDFPPPVTCDICGGNGISEGGECELCGGDGEEFPPAEDGSISFVLLANGQRLAARYLAIVRDHGGSLFVAVEQGDAKVEPLRFAGDGFEGLVMPVTIVN